MRPILASVAVVCAAAGAASAQTGKSLHVDSIRHFEGGGTTLRGPSFYSTGFETAESFVVGPIATQNGWVASGTNNPAFNVNTINPFAGAQHLRVGFDSTVSAGTQRVVFSPNLGPTPAGDSITSVQVSISNDGGADYDAVGQAPSQGFLSWRVKFRWQGPNAGDPGAIYILDDTDLGTPGNQLGFVNTGVVWNEGVYTELRVEMNAAANSIQYYYGGSLIYTSAAGIFAGTSVEQFVVVTDNFQEANEFGDFDNLVMVPAPGALAMAGLGLAAAGRRRRRA